MLAKGRQCGIPSDLASSRPDLYVNKLASLEEAVDFGDCTSVSVPSCDSGSEEVWSPELTKGVVSRGVTLAMPGLHVGSEAGVCRPPLLSTAVPVASTPVPAVAAQAFPRPPPHYPLCASCVRVPGGEAVAVFACVTRVLTEAGCALMPSQAKAKIAVVVVTHSGAAELALRCWSVDDAVVVEINKTQGSVALVWGVTALLSTALCEPSRPLPCLEKAGLDIPTGLPSSSPSSSSSSSLLAAPLAALTSPFADIAAGGVACVCALSQCPNAADTMCATPGLLDALIGAWLCGGCTGLGAAQAGLTLASLSSTYTRALAAAVALGRRGAVPALLRGCVSGAGSALAITTRRQCVTVLANLCVAAGAGVSGIATAFGSEWAAVPAALASVCACGDGPTEAAGKRGCTAGTAVPTPPPASFSLSPLHVLTSVTPARALAHARALLDAYGAAVEEKAGCKLKGLVWCPLGPVEVMVRVLSTPAGPLALELSTLSGSAMVAGKLYVSLSQAVKSGVMASRDSVAPLVTPGPQVGRAVAGADAAPLLSLLTSPLPGQVQEALCVLAGLVYEGLQPCASLLAAVCGVWTRGLPPACRTAAAMVFAALADSTEGAHTVLMALGRTHALRAVAADVLAQPSFHTLHLQRFLGQVIARLRGVEKGALLPGFPHIVL